MVISSPWNHLEFQSEDETAVSVCLGNWFLTLCEGTSLLLSSYGNVEGGHVRVDP